MNSTLNKFLSIFVVFGSLEIAEAQKKDDLSIGFESNSQYYIDDKKTGDFKELERFRSNNYLKVDYSYDNFFIGFQTESYAPDALLNYAPSLDQTNIALYYAGYKSEKLEITAGYFYEQYGSGLILRSWEDRQLGINNALRGGRFKFTPHKSIELSGFYANQREGFDVSEGDIMGFNSEISLSEWLKFDHASLGIGLSYVGRNQTATIDNPEFKNLTNAFSGRIDYSQDNFFSSLEYVYKSGDAVIIFDQVRNVKDGNALELNLGYSKKGLGINTTFRRMENMSFYSDRNATGNVFNSNVINYIPALTKQHDYLLTNIYVYQAQPQISFQDITLIKAGEIGGQFDLFYQIKKNSSLGGKRGAKIAFNYSFWHGLKGDYDYENFDYTTEFLGFGEKYFTDMSLEFRKKISNDWTSIFYFVKQFYNKRFIEETFGEIKTNILVGESTYKMSKGKALRFELQHLWSKDDRKNWVGGTLEFNVNSSLAFYVNDIYNYGSDDPSENIHYYNVGSSYIFGANRASLNYGRQRGGLICVGGVCRFVPESTGLTASIVLSL